MRTPQGDKPAYAVNWRSIILADAAIGVALLVISGVLFAFGFDGWSLTAGTLGIVYLFFNIRRFLRWRYLRRDAGLDT